MLAISLGYCGPLHGGGAPAVAGPGGQTTARAGSATSEHLIHGLGHVHMDTSCSPSVRAHFDRALALLHNFWYAHALTAFNEVIKGNPQCAMAYWGAAMTYNHPFWDAPTAADESAAWALVQKGMQATEKSPREKMYRDAVAGLYKDAGAGSKAARAYAKVAASARAGPTIWDYSPRTNVLSGGA